MRRSLSQRLATIAAGALLACAGERRVLAPEPDPSRPDSPEAPSPTVPRILAEPLPTLQKGVRPEAPPAGHAHPEVTGTTPGRCPKCGMQLVPASHAGHVGGAP